MLAFMKPAVIFGGGDDLQRPDGIAPRFCGPFDRDGRAAAPTELSDYGLYSIATLVASI
jgi:hypothetical protein